jgi:hypothetical protein
MADSDQFLNYAEEALLWASQSKTEKEKQLLLELACTWTRAAVESGRTPWPSTAVPQGPGYRVGLVFAPRHPKWEAL